MLPFSYPTSKHQRTLSPGPFTAYQTYKKHLKVEFENKCIYCRTPDATLRPSSFAVEHYQPKGRFPQLRCSYPNLFYACARCNSYKGEHWPTKAEKLAGDWIPNPCADVMSSHLRYKGKRISALSAPGHFTLDLLELDDPDEESRRDLIVTFVQKCDEDIKKWRRAIALARAALAVAKPAHRSAIQADITSYTKKLAVVSARLAKAQGL